MKNNDRPLIDAAWLELWKQQDLRRPAVRSEWLADSLRHSEHAIKRTLRFYSGFAILTSLGAAANLLSFWTIPLLWVIFLGSSAIAAYCWSIYRRVRAIDDLYQSVVERLESLAALYELQLPRWFLAAACVPWLATMTLLVRIDGVDGHYTIHNHLQFVLISAAMFAISWLGMRLSMRSALRELQAAAADLRLGSLDHSPAAVAQSKQAQRWCYVLVLVLVLGVLAGLYLWWKAS